LYGYQLFHTNVGGLIEVVGEEHQRRKVSSILFYTNMGGLIEAAHQQRRII